MLGRSGQVKVSSPVWKGHLCAPGDPTGNGLLDQPRMVEKGPSRNKLFSPLPSFSPSPSIVSLLLSALSSSFCSPETEGRAAAVPQWKGNDLRKRLKKVKREGGVRDRPWPHKCAASSGAQQFLFHTCLYGHSSIRVDLNVRRTGVWYLCHPQLIVPLSFFNCLLSTDLLLISCHTGVPVQQGDVPHLLSVRKGQYASYHEVWDMICPASHKCACQHACFLSENCPLSINSIMEKLAMYHNLASCPHRKHLSKVMDKSTQTGTHTNNAHDKHTFNFNTD